MIEKIKKNRFLFEELVKRDFNKKYKRTVLGILWSVLSPLLMLLIMKLVFTQFFGKAIEHYTIYLFCGNIIFSFFSESTTQGMQALVANSKIFTKINVPKYIFVFSKNVQTLINFLITVLLLFVFCFIDGVFPTWKWILLLYPICMLVLFNIGLGMILSALHVLFKDMQYLWGVCTRLIMYVSAIFYQITSYSETVQYLFLANPVYLFIRYFRKIILDGVIPTPEFHMLIAFDTIFVILVGVWMYKRYNHEFLYRL